MVNSKDFILKTARDNNIESFFLFRNDPDDPASLIYSGDKPKGMDDKMAELEYHLNCDYGVVYLQMRSKAGLGPVFKNRHDRNCIIFQDKVNLSEQPKAVDPVKPLGNIPEQAFSQSPSLELVRQYEGEKMNMQQTIGQLTTQMAQIEMENRHRFELDRKDREIETLKKELEAAKSSDSKILGYLTQFSDILSPGPVSTRPMAGVGTEAPSENKKVVIDAVNTLIDLDPNFHVNISKLAKMAQSNPTIYKQATTILNSMG